MKYFLAVLLLFVTFTGRGAPVEPQPFLAALRSLVDAADYVGSPFTAEETVILGSAIGAQDAAAVERVQAVLDQHALFVVSINPEQRVKAAMGSAEPLLNEGGWRQYLVKVVNESGTTAPLRITS